METQNNEKTKQRETQLFTLGLSKRAFGFSFKSITVATFYIEVMEDVQWDRYIEYLTKSVAEIKAALSQISDKDKLMLFCKELQEVPGPELKHAKSRELLEGLLNTIREFSEYALSEVNAMEDEPTGN